MGPVRQNPIQRTVRSVHVCVHCTVHNSCAQYCTEQTRYFPSYPQVNHHCSDDVYLREVENHNSRGGSNGLLQWRAPTGVLPCQHATTAYGRWTSPGWVNPNDGWLYNCTDPLSQVVRGCPPGLLQQNGSWSNSVVNLLGIHSCMSSQMEPTPLNKIINWKETGSLPESGIGNVRGIRDVENFTEWQCVKSIQSPSKSLHDSWSVRLILQHREDTGSVQTQCVHLRQRHTIHGNANADYLRLANAIGELCALMYPQVNWDFVWSAGTILPRSPGCHRELR